jgi:hypothetical protein
MGQYVHPAHPFRVWGFLPLGNSRTMSVCVDTMGALLCGGLQCGVYSGNCLGSLFLGIIWCQIYLVQLHTMTQKNLISIDLDLWHFMVLFAIITAVKLLQCMGAGGCDCPISLSMSQNFVACLQLRKRALSSASGADGMTNPKITHSVTNTPFNLMEPVGSGFHPMKKRPARSAVGVCLW